MSYAKKISIALVALLILILLCVWKNAGSISSMENSGKKNNIEFDLKKRGSDLAFSGIFGKKDDMKKLISSMDLTENVKIEKINYDKRLHLNDIESVMKELAPAFLGVVQNGRIGYHGGQLLVSGTVDSDKSRRAIETILKSFDTPYYLQIEVKEKNQSHGPDDMNSYSPQEREVAKDIGEILKFETIEFQTGSARLTSKGIAVVDKIAAVLKEHQDVRVMIAGHTDNVGDPASNMKLSKARVRSVKARLVSRGIDADRMETVGFGETRPIFPNTTEENRRRNRRVEFTIITSKGEK